MSKFDFHGNVPKEVRAVADAHLLPLEWMIPAWCQALHVEWDGAGDGDTANCSMSITVNFEYRDAYLVIRPAFLEVSEERRRDSCIHELIHLHINPLYNYLDRTLKVLLDEDKQHQVLALDEARRYVEGVTQDLTETVFKRLCEVKSQK